MKHVDPNQILNAVKVARYQNSKGILNPDIKNSTNHLFWLPTRNINNTKQLLLQMAKSKQPRPHSRKHPLGFSFNNYINPKKSTYDPIFTKKVSKLAPHWFISRSNIADANKQQLLLLAKSKKPRPNSKLNPLGRALVNYSNKFGKCYDPIFTKQIKSLAPHWFKKDC